MRPGRAEREAADRYKREREREAEARKAEVEAKRQEIARRLEATKRGRA